MLPLGGVANNLIPRPNPPSAPATFPQSDSANLPVGRYQLDAAAAPGSLNSPASNYLGAPPRSLGAEGGLLSAIQNQGSSGGLVGLQLSPPSSSSGSSSGGLPNYPTPVNVVASGNYPSSLSSSGSLANLGIIPSKFEDPPTPELGSPSVAVQESGPTSAPPLSKENRPTPQVHHGTYIHLLLLCFSFDLFQTMNTLLQPTI